MGLLRLLLVLTVLVAVAGAVCRRRVSIAIDVSASLSVDSATGKSKPGPAEIKAALKSTMQSYLFKDRQSCVAVYRFATNATLLMDFAEVALEATRSALIAAVDGLVFETAYPGYYTNWEAGLQAIAERTTVKSNSVYLVTDGDPTTRVTGCDLSNGQPCLDVSGDVARRENLEAARRVSAAIQATGAWVVAVGMGPMVSDEALAAVSGPCVSPSNPRSCIKGWNYFHANTVSRLGVPLGRSIEDRLVDETPENVVLARLQERKSNASSTSESTATTTSTTNPVIVERSRTSSPVRETLGQTTTLKRVIAPKTTKVPTNTITQESAQAKTTIPTMSARSSTRRAISTTQPPTPTPVIRYEPNVFQVRLETPASAMVAASDPKLSGGAIAGIVIGSVIGFVVLGIVASFVIHWYLNTVSAPDGGGADRLNWATLSSSSKPIPTGPFPAPRYKRN